METLVWSAGRLPTQLHVSFDLHYRVYVGSYYNVLKRVCVMFLFVH